MNGLHVPIKRAIRQVLLGGSSSCRLSGFTTTSCSPCWLSRKSSTASSKSSGDNYVGGNGIGQKTTAVYLHVGPSGDCWTGHSIFAAKHLQPDYVKSVKLPNDTNIDMLLELLDKKNALARSIYDSGIIPLDLLQQSKLPENNE